MVEPEMGWRIDEDNNDDDAGKGERGEEFSMFALIYMLCMLEIWRWSCFIAIN
jgi:hypothetical protein